MEKEYELTWSYTSPFATITYSTAHGTAPASKKVLKGYVLTSEDLPTLSDSYYIFDGGNKSVGNIINENTTITALWHEPNLKKYRELEYIGATSTTYGANGIDPETVFRIRGTYEIKYALRPQTHSYDRVICGVASPAKDDIIDIHYATSNPKRLTIKGRYSASEGRGMNGTASSPTYYDNNPHVIKIKDYNASSTGFDYRTTAGIDGQQIYSGAMGNGYEYGDVSLLHGVDRDAAINLYYAKLNLIDSEYPEDDGRDLVPAQRKSDGVIGMWDKVEGRFHTNKGNVPFVAGPTVNENPSGSPNN